MQPTIGFIGQGWIGKHYADDFEARGFAVVRYALEEPYTKNEELLQTCAIIFIAVPTPTTPAGFDASIVRAVLQKVPKGAIAVIKSTLLPGTTELLQSEYPDVFVLHSPEFLREATAAYDAAHPERNLIGIPIDSVIYQEKAATVLSVLPAAPYSKVMPAKAAELVKYAGNCFLYTKVVFMNVLYDLAQKEAVDFSLLAEVMAADPRIGASHMNPVHNSGRGAGGHCFIKDFEAFRRLCAQLDDPHTDALLTALVDKNNQLLQDTKKDLDLLAGVYGKSS